MSGAGSKLAALREEVLAEVERLISAHPAEQNAVVRAHIAANRSNSRGLHAGAIALGIARALGLGREEALQIAVIPQLLELAGLALATLPEEDNPDRGTVAASDGVPLALNSADALYSLAHVALAEYQETEGASSGAAARVLDTMAARAWEAAHLHEGYFADASAFTAAAAAAAGGLAATLAGGDEATVGALGAFAAALATAGSSTKDALATANVTPAQREALLALAE